LLCLCLSLPCYGQEGKMFTVDRELSSSMLNKIYQDREGIIWIATEDGLNRYDGAKFTVYRNEKDNPNSLLSDIVRRQSRSPFYRFSKRIANIRPRKR
jgi:hypothetical protein